MEKLYPLPRDHLFLFQGNSPSLDILATNGQSAGSAPPAPSAIPPRQVRVRIAVLLQSPNCATQSDQRKGFSCSL